MPTLDTAFLYPGTCLIEGTNLSEGRGTAKPFELIGAPFIDAPALADRLNQRKLAGVHFRPAYCTPTFSKHQGQLCGGHTGPSFRPHDTSPGRPGPRHLARCL